MSSKTSGKVRAGPFYEQFHGHPTRSIETVISGLKEQNESAPIVYFAGDSSLDNKHWFFDPHFDKKTQLYDEGFTSDAINGYEDILSPPRMVNDVSYWLNKKLKERLGEKQAFTINTSVEATTLGERRRDLLPQDKIIRDNITSKDYLIVSIGGNDIALAPTSTTLFYMATLLVSPSFLIRSGYALGMRYFIQLFTTKIEDYIDRLTAKEKPSKVFVCMIYYPDETPGNGWADGVLKLMGYNRNPKKLQLIIKMIFEAMKQEGINVGGKPARIIPLFKVLDGQNTVDYLERVEPSVEGGEKMAECFADCLLEEMNRN